MITSTTRRALRGFITTATATAAAVAVVLAGCSSSDFPGIDDAVVGAQNDVTYAAPTPGAPWQLVLSGDAPADAGAAVYDLDASASTAQLDALRAANAEVYLLCYVSVGTWEEWRSDADAFPDAVLGEALPDWPGERYVDVRTIDVLSPIWEARLDRCTAAGFNAVDPDNIDVYANDSGFAITEADVADAMAWLANEAHARGLAIGQKNAPALVAVLSPLLDFAVVEECLELNKCDAYAPYLASGKPVFAVEYTDQGTIPEGNCDRAANVGLSLLVSTVALDSLGTRCE